MSKPGNTGSNSDNVVQKSSVLFLALLIFAISSAIFPPLHSMWVDETSSYFFSSLPLASFLEHLANAEANMSLYYIALKVYLLTGITNPWYIRALSVLFGMFGIVCMYGFSLRYINRQVAFWVAIFAAFNPYIFKYFWEARAYSMALFFGALLTWLFWASIVNNRGKSWLLYGLAAGIGLYSHIFLLLLVISQYAFALCYCIVRQTFSEYFIKLLLAGLLIIAIAAPLLSFFLLAASEAPNIDWIRKVGVSHTWGLLENILKSKYSWHVVPVTLSALILLFSMAMSLTLFVKAYRRDRNDSQTYLPLYLAMCAVIPVVLIYLLQFFKPMFIERYLIFITPCFLILCVWAVLSLPASWLRITGILAIGTTQAFGMFESHNRNTFDFHSLYSDLATQCEPGSTLIFVNASVSTTYLYYKDHYPNLDKCFSKNVPDHLDYKNFYHRLEIGELKRPRRGESFWIVFGHAGSSDNSIYKLHDLEYLEANGFSRPYYQQYPIKLALIQLQAADNKSQERVFDKAER
jgi:uncharacterized membrane protein